MSFSNLIRNLVSKNRDYYARLFDGWLITQPFHLPVIVNRFVTMKHSQRPFHSEGPPGSDLYFEFQVASRTCCGAPGNEDTRAREAAGPAASLRFWGQVYNFESEWRWGHGGPNPPRQSTRGVRTL